MSVLENRTLVLNKNWKPLALVTVQGAIQLIIKGSARGLCSETYTKYNWEEWIDQDKPPVTTTIVKSASYNVPAPEVIILTKYDKFPRKKVKFSSKAIFQRDQWQCQYCGKNLSDKEISIDHILAKSRGGKNSWQNCVSCCKKCNCKKGSMTLEEAGMKLLSKPTVPNVIPFLGIEIQIIPKIWLDFIGNSVKEEVYE